MPACVNTCVCVYGHSCVRVHVTVMNMRVFHNQQLFQEDNVDNINSACTDTYHTGSSIYSRPKDGDTVGQDEFRCRIVETHFQAVTMHVLTSSHFKSLTSILHSHFSEYLFDWF